MKKTLSIALAAALVLSLVACGSSEPTEATNSSTPTPHQESVNEPEPEPEPDPVVEWVPFESITYTGSGDDVIEIAPPSDRPWSLEISGNAASRHFAVEGFDAEMESTELFVNTTAPYMGVVIDPSLSTVMLEISAKDEWSITVHDLYATVPGINKGDTITGFGDAVYEIISCGNTADISGNSDGHHFAVETFGNSRDELLVNTVDPYEGTVMLKGDPFLLIINSESDWTITF